MADDQVSAGDDGGYDNYVETTVDPGIWLLLFTCLFCAFVMLVLVPVLVWWKIKQRNKHDDDYADGNQGMALGASEKDPVETNFRSIVSFDKETRKILRVAVPFTIQGLASTSLSNVCLAMVGRHVGTKAVAAYALVQILVGLTDGVIQGPIWACTTLCSHAVGAGNYFLAGQYIQLAMLTYLLLNIPAVFFWWKYMAEVVSFLEWGDEETAQMAEDFIKVYIWSYVLGGISTCVWQLLEVADHAAEGSVMSILWGIVNVIVISTLVNTKEEATLTDVGLCYIGTALFFIGLTFALAEFKGWLRPFKGGLFKSLSLKNWAAIKLMVTQAIPLAFGSLLSNAEWAILTFMASALGPAEVAAWAILGSIWEVFYSATAGIGSAAALRVGLHFGANRPTMAKLSGYKALLMSMLVASIVSIVYFSLQDRIPQWFTVDPTLQAMLRELVPFVGVANLSMQFGMTSWSLIGAQGRYKLATWVSFISSWGVCMPMAAVFVYVFRIDLQGLTSAVAVGYVSTGAALSYVLLSTDWKKVAREIQETNAAASSGSTSNGDTSGGGGDVTEEELYASLNHHSAAARVAARRGIRFVSIPPGQRSGIILGNVYTRPGTFVLMVRNWSPLYGRVRNGDVLMALDGKDVTRESARDISARLKNCKGSIRDLTFVSPMENTYGDDDDDVLFEAIAEDDSSEAPGPTGTKSMESMDPHFPDILPNTSVQPTAPFV
jgi:multidrug resistance protein, MATE family